MISLRARHAIVLGSVIYGAWLLLSGHYTPFLLAIGLICTIGVVYVALRMEVVDEEGVPVIHLTWNILTYLPWLIAEAVKSNLVVARIILRRNLAIDPAMIRVRGRQQTDLGRVIYANSITLTPGTVTVSVKGENLHVHALDANTVAGMDEAEMNIRVAALERRMGLS